MVDKSDISDAIVLFEYSQTARASGRASNVIRNLKDLLKRNEIGFVPLPRSKSGGVTWGEYAAGRAAFDLRLNSQHFPHLPAKEQLGAISLTLVHEGAHATAEFEPRSLNGEHAARILPIYYYRELSGPGVFNEANDPLHPGKQWGTIRITPNTVSGSEYQAESDALKKDQLLDLILSNTTYADYIKGEWIIDKLQLWGGLKNRWLTTRGLYIRVLARDRFRLSAKEIVYPYYTAAILDIMESVERRDEWTVMMKEAMKEAGALRTIQLALDDISASQQFSARIVQLERKWGVRLTEEPPKP